MPEPTPLQSARERFPGHRPADVRHGHGRDDSRRQCPVRERDCRQPNNRGVGPDERLRHSHRMELCQRSSSSRRRATLIDRRAGAGCAGSSAFTSSGFRLQPSPYGLFSTHRHMTWTRCSSASRWQLARPMPTRQFRISMPHMAGSLRDDPRDRRRQGGGPPKTDFVGRRDDDVR